MTTQEYAQAIDEAYRQYVTLFENNAPQDEQDDQFARYMQLREGAAPGPTEEPCYEDWCPNEVAGYCTRCHRAACRKHLHSSVDGPLCDDHFFGLGCDDDGLAGDDEFPENSTTITERYQCYHAGLAAFFQAVAILASQEVDPFCLDWETANEWRELQDAWELAGGQS